MKRAWMRASYVVVALGLAVCCLAAVRPDWFGIGKKDRQAAGEGDSSETGAQAPAVDALGQFTLEREQLRSMQLIQLDEIIHSAETSPEIVASAQTEKLEILRRMEIEQTVAGILRARGYLGAAVAASKDTVNVMIRKSAVGERDAAIILELVLSETEVKAGDVKIIPVE